MIQKSEHITSDGRTFIAHSHDGGHSWWGVWDDESGELDDDQPVEWLLVPRPGHDDDLVIRAEWNGSRFDYNVVATVPAGAPDNVAAQLADASGCAA